MNPVRPINRSNGVSRSNGVKRLAISFINFYRKYLSMLRLPSCRFYPSCSQYAVEAIEKKGLLRGSFLSLKRILRCHPFSKGGYNPVE